MLKNVFLITCAGAVGTFFRYALSQLVSKVWGVGFPWGTSFVNVFGCFLFGLVWSSADVHLRISPEAKAIILTGFMGAFTTFSTFIFDTGIFLKHSKFLLAGCNLMFQIALGLLFLFLGFRAGG